LPPQETYDLKVQSFNSLLSATFDASNKIDGSSLTDVLKVVDAYSAAPTVFGDYKLDKAGYIKVASKVYQKTNTFLPGLLVSSWFYLLIMVQPGMLSTPDLPIRIS
jgi:hypothetical protein